jgi:hypothetical protein
MRIPPAAVALTLLLVVNGCGPLSKREYIKRADRICGQLIAKQAEVGAGADFKEQMKSYGAKGDEVVAYSQRARERLGKLKAPNELKDRMRAFLVQLDRELDHQRRVIAAAKRGDAVRFLTVELGGDTREKPAAPGALQSAARRVGFTVCGTG